MVYHHVLKISLIGKIKNAVRFDKITHPAKKQVF